VKRDSLTWNKHTHSLKLPANYKLMEWDRPPWEINEFIELKYPITPSIIQAGWNEIEHSRISNSKNKISDFSNVEEWEIRKKITNPYEAVFSGEDNFPSLAKVQPLSRSYFKMIEMLGVINFFTQTRTSLTTAHICEGPGGFVQHVVEQAANKIPSKVFAMTLKPTRSHIPGWRRSIHFIKKYPQIQLEYGADDTGNVLIPENQADFCTKVYKAGGADLFTADGGFDFSVDYKNQELMAFPLLLASFTMGLNSLKVGGVMIIKLFDIYARATQDLFLGSATFFESFTIYKPATSRPCNSERYFIGRGFIGMSDELEKWIDILREAQVKHHVSPITQLVEGWPEEVMDAVKEQILFQEEIQIQCIEDTLNLDTNTIADRLLKNIQLSKEWCKTFGVKY
jgi:23S rRNA U2552 (ribose-2'-O)-methylase RlmE/FtsJ